MNIGNQPAFPYVVPGALTDPSHHAGMTYRQYLVGQVLAGISTRLLTVDGSELLGLVSESKSVNPNEAIAFFAIELADAVIKKLEAE